MKIFSAVVLVIGLSFGCVFASGCSLFGDIKGAVAAYEESKKNAEDAQAEIEAMIVKYNALVAQWKAAMAAGDATKAGELVDAGQAVLNEINSARENYKAIEKALSSAVDRVRGAEDSNKYLTGILSILGIGVGAFAGRYPLVGKIAELGTGVLKVMAEADKHMPADAYTAFAKAAGDKMTPAEFAAFNKAAGANAIDTAWTGK